MTDRDENDSALPWATRFARFDGGVDALAAALADIRSDLGWMSDDPEPNTRLIRYYVTEGALDKPERRGKEAFYGFRQLAQYVAVRSLLKDGWPLAKAAAETISRPTEELVALTETLQGARSEAPPTAEALVEKFQSDLTSFKRADAKPIAKEISSRQLALSARLGSPSRDLSILSAEGQPVAPKEVLRIDLADWCSVSVDRDRAEELTEEQARLVADALYRALMDVRVSRTRAKKRS